MFLFAFLFVALILAVWTWYHPESFFIPINLLYNIDPSSRTNFYSDADKYNIFPVSRELESIWQDIKHECHELYESLPDKDINYLDNYNINLGDETKRHWTTIPLRVFGHDSHDYMDKCPITSKILYEHPEIKSCIFSIMEPGKIIKPHVGPYDGLLRYQLALDIPNTSNSVNLSDSQSDKLTLVANQESSLFINEFSQNECYLHVGGERYEWTEGHGIMFDESNLHGAVNTTQYKRMVLIIDLERPYSLLPYRIMNKFIIWAMGKLTYVIT